MWWMQLGIQSQSGATMCGGPFSGVGVGVGVGHVPIGSVKFGVRSLQLWISSCFVLGSAQVCGKIDRDTSLPHE